MIRVAACACAAVLVAGARLVAQPPLPAPDSPAAVLLSPGAPVERSLAGTARHDYDLALQAGDYAALTVDQHGTDLVIRILDASGCLCRVGLGSAALCSTESISTHPIHP